MRACSATN